MSCFRRKSCAQGRMWTGLRFGWPEAVFGECRRSRKSVVGTKGSGVIKRMSFISAFCRKTFVFRPLVNLSPRIGSAQRTPRPAAIRREGPRALESTGLKSKLSEKPSQIRLINLALERALIEQYYVCGQPAQDCRLRTVIEPQLVR
jgi:hypothetical protein